MCNEEIDDCLTQSAPFTESITVLKERDSKYPLIFPERKTATRGLLTTEVKDYLGCSYRLDKFPLGTAINVGSPIIDINKIRKEEGFYVQDHNVGIQEMEPFSYSTFDRYTLKSKDTEKVTTGFNINVKLFSFGNKKLLKKYLQKMSLMKAKEYMDNWMFQSWA